MYLNVEKGGKERAKNLLKEEKWSTDGRGEGTQDYEEE